MNKAYPPPKAVLLQRFAIKDAMTCGGTALILTCKDLQKNRIVTVKRFFPESLLPELEKRVRTEPLLPIRSEFVAKSEETFFADGCLHSVQPLILGETLSDLLITKDSLPEKDAAHIGLCLGHALSALHSAKILSTDVKPDNVIVTPQNKAVLIDLSAFEQPYKRPEVSLGTPPYSAPELLQKDILYPATDIFSLGMILFHALIGNEAFEDIQEKEKSINRIILSQEFKKISPLLWPVVAKATHPHSAMRQRTAGEFVREISSVYSSLTSVERSFFLCIKGEKFKVPQGVVVIGRAILSPRNLRIEKEQFALKNDCPSLYVLDLGQRVKTTLNGINLWATGWTKARTGDVLGVADIKITVNAK